MNVIGLDTNILIEEPKSIYAFPDDLVVIPRVVLNELDGLKESIKTDVRRNARRSSWILDAVTEANEDDFENEYMVMENGGLLMIDGQKHDPIDPTDPNKPDNIIISALVAYAKTGDFEKVTLYSNDVNVRVMTRAEAKTYKLKNLKSRAYALVDKSLSDIESGVTEIFLSSSEMVRTRANKYIDMKLDFVNGEHIILTDETNLKHQILAQYDAVMNKVVALPDYSKGEPILKAVDGDAIRPIDARQTFMAHDILNTEKDLHFILSRVAGAGKSYLTTVCALKLLKDQDYDRLIVIKPMTEVGNEKTGFLPGTKEEKLAPWFDSFKDIMTEITIDGQDTMLADLGARIELEVVTHMRGRSIPNTIIYIDESQNFSEETLKTIITRLGKYSKLILSGDLSQIDNPRLDSDTTGLRVWAERSRNINHGYGNSTYILLDTNFRSDLSAWASSFYE
jgi:PhoH-like ATPase